MAAFQITNTYNNNNNNFSKYKYRRNKNKKDKRNRGLGLDLDKIKEISVLRSMDKRRVFPPDMLWEIWWFIPSSVKQIFVTARISYLIKTYITSINRVWLYQQGKLIDIISAIPEEKLLKFIQFGSPAKYYIKPTHRTEDTLYEHITSSEPWHLRFDIMFNLINMIVGAHDENRIPTMVALINALIHIHRKYAKEGVVFDSIIY